MNAMVMLTVISVVGAVALFVALGAVPARDRANSRRSADRPPASWLP